MSVATIKRSKLKKEGWKFVKHVFECAINSVSVAKYVNEEGKIFIAVQEASGRLLADTRVDFDTQEELTEYLEDATSEEHWGQNFRALRDLLVRLGYLESEEEE